MNDPACIQHAHTHMLEAQLLGLWRRLLKSGTLSIDDDFFVSGGDSLLAVDMLLKMEEVLGASSLEGS